MFIEGFLGDQQTILRIVNLADIFFGYHAESGMG